MATTKKKKTKVKGVLKGAVKGGATKKVSKPKNRTVSTYKAHQIYNAVWDVWISGTKMGWDKKQCITDISVTETVNGSDVARLTIVDPEYQYIEDNIFYEDNPIKIKFGWEHDTYRITFKGYISAIDISFGADGIPILSVMCMDNTHKMNRKYVTKTWKKTTSQAVVKKIVKKYGFKFKGQSGYKFKKQNFSQNHQTDIAFIQQLAQNETHPFTARLVGKTFYYQKKGILKTPKMDLTYRDYPYDIISFSPQINKNTKTSYKGGSTNTSKKKPTSASANVPNSSTGKTSSGKTSTSGKNASKGTSKNNYTYNPKTKKWSKK